MRGIQQIDVNISKLEQTAKADVAAALRALTEAIACNGQISNELRSELVEQLHGLSDQALLPPDQRNTGVVRAIVGALSSSLNAVSALATIWATWGDTIRSAFNL